jgi:hypothetical protein
MSEYTLPEHCATCGDPTALCQCKAREAVAEPSRDKFARYEMVRQHPDEEGKAPRYSVYGIYEDGVRVRIDTIYLRDIAVAQLEREIAEKDADAQNDYKALWEADAAKLEAAEARVAVLEKTLADHQRIRVKRRKQHARIDFVRRDRARKAEKDALALREALRDVLETIIGSPKASIGSINNTYQTQFPVRRIDSLYEALLSGVEHDPEALGKP